MDSEHRAAVWIAAIGAAVLVFCIGSCTAIELNRPAPAAATK